MRVLLTGIAGFAGSHLAEYLVQQPDIEIHGIVHRHDRRIQHLLGQLHLHRGDMRNALWVSELVQEVQPEITMHWLPGAMWVEAGNSPWTTYELNIQCQLNLLEALRRWSPDCHTVITTSNEVYGLVKPGDLPIGEQTPFRPNSPYGVSKVAQDMMALQYWNSHRLPTVRARAFNHIGPGQSDDFAASAFARQIAEIEAGLRPAVVKVGNLHAERDFTDVRDVVAAYWLLAMHGEPGGVYNVGSGVARPVHWLLETLLSLTTAIVSIETDPERMRPSDVPRSVCDNRKLIATTEWRPQVSLEESLYAMLADWRGRVKT